MDPKIAALLDRLDDASHDEHVELAAAIRQRYDELDGGEESLAATQEMVKLGHAASELAPFLARGRVGQLAQLTASTETAGTVARMARRRPVPSPEAARSGGGTALVASGMGGGRMQGDTFADKWELAEAMSRTLKSLADGWHGKCIVASADWRDQYQAERKLSDSLAECERKMDAVTGLQALLATGGICQPTNVDYSIGTWATAARPLRDALVQFEASRGGVRYIVPGDISEWAAATTVWLESTDAEPGTATKPVKAMTCGEEKVIYTAAIPTRLGFGNFQARFAPEQVASTVELAAAAAARIAENHLLEVLEEIALKDITTAKLLGGFRDLLTAIDTVGANYRQTHRIPPETMLSICLPEWMKVMAKEDLARESAHQQGNDWNSLMVTDEQIEDVMRVHRVRPIWHLDGQAEPASKHFPSQSFVAAAEASAIKKYPTKTAWYVWVDGSVQFLDGGRLDLGVVRDSTLDATNEMEMFHETFEGLAQRGFPNSVLQVVSELAPTGASSGTEKPESP
jgi:hypothetical protein